MRLLPILIALAVVQPQGGAYERRFTDDTMRVDVFHTGGPRAGETLALDRVVHDGPWPGSRTQLLDDMNLGPYRFEVRDAASGDIVYSRGFASIYGEWETTAEAKSVHRTFHESLRFPWPRQPVDVSVRKRQADGTFGEPLWTTRVEPGSRFVNRAAAPAAAPVRALIDNGPPATKVDLLLVAEGYTRNELPKFRQDAERLVGALFREEPFRSRRADFNVRLLELTSAESGVNRPNAGVFRRTPISTEYNIFDSERYMLTLDNRALRDAASAAPYEFIEILVNDRTYGGGGIYNDHATTSAGSAFADYIFIHEFAHHFAALGDEYYTSDVAYETGAPRTVEPWEPNITALLDPASLKWRDLVTPGTPLPTPWQKEEFERHSREIQAVRREIRARNAPEAEMDALFRKQQVFETKLLASMTHSGKVGAFEGAGYEAKGLYRPQADCIMFTRNPVGFCAVCRRALERIIDFYAR